MAAYIIMSDLQFTGVLRLRFRVWFAHCSCYCHCLCQSGSVNVPSFTGDWHHLCCDVGSVSTVSDVVFIGHLTALTSSVPVIKQCSAENASKLLSVLTCDFYCTDIVDLMCVCESDTARYVVSRFCSARSTKHSVVAWQDEWESQTDGEDSTYSSYSCCAMFFVSVIHDGLNQTHLGLVSDQFLLHVTGFTHCAYISLHVLCLCFYCLVLCVHRRYIIVTWWGEPS